jgi:hypothetical protein
MQGGGGESEGGGGASFYLFMADGAGVMCYSHQCLGMFPQIVQL